MVSVTTSARFWLTSDQLCELEQRLGTLNLAEDGATASQSFPIESISQEEKTSRA